MTDPPDKPTLKVPPVAMALMEPFVVRDDGADVDAVEALDPNWPSGLAVQKDYVFALGVVALNYGQLESVFKYLFAEVAGMNEPQVDAFFDRLGNEHRRNILAQLVPQTILPDGLKETVTFFSDGFRTCAENRHLLMHSRAGGVFRKAASHGMILLRTSRAGVRMICEATLTDLCRVADETTDYVHFGAMVASDVNLCLRALAAGDDERAARFALRDDRPPKPAPLTWKPASS